MEFSSSSPRVTGLDPSIPLPSRPLRLTAFSLYDFADSAFATSIVTVLFSQYYAGVVAGGKAGTPILGQPIPGATLFAWLVSLSMALVAVTAPFLGVLADRHGSRIRSMALAWLPGVALTFSLAAVGPGDWLSGGLAFVGAYAFFGAASVFYNALLPELGPPETLGRASGIAWGVGYLGGAFLLVLNLIMLQRPQLLGFPPGAFSITDCFATAAAWWLLFSLPIFVVFRYEDRSGRARRTRMLRDGGSAPNPAMSPTVLQAVRASVRQVERTLALLLRLPNLRRFFLSYLLYNDGVQTIVAMASIFGAQVLGMQPDSLILFFLAIQGTAFLGSIALGRLADRCGHRPVLLLCVGAWTLTTLWAAAIGLFGAPVREYWVLGPVSGLFLGGIQSCSRSMLAHWIPAGKESELFGFFSVFSRAASIFGPLVYGALVLATGSLRRAILSVTLFFVAGGVLLLRVRVAEISGERARLAEGIGTKV